MKTFWHGSMIELPVGTILTPRPDYAERWDKTDFYNPLERYRPPHLISHKDAVFMCDNRDDIGLAGGGEAWFFQVEPIGSIQKHDMNWSSEISCLVSDNAPEDEIKLAALNYWNGEPHFNEQVWEYLVPKARILKVIKGY